MEIIDFEESNCVFAKDQEEYLSLPAYKGGDKVVSCWELSDEDIEKLKETKKIYLCLLTFNRPLQPQLLTVNKEEVIP